MCLPDDIIRVFPRKAAWVPDDDMAYVGGPDLFVPHAKEVHVSCTFSWDETTCKRLVEEWRTYFKTVKIGGPAYGSFCGDFVPGMYVKQGYVITSRGCINKCKFCCVPEREGSIRELPITDGWRVMDSNFLACSRNHIERVFEMLRRQPHPARFQGSIEAGLVDDFFCELLRTIKVGVIYVSFDKISGQKIFAKAADMLRDYGISRAARKSLCLVGYGDDTPVLAEERLRWVFSMGMTPLASYYRPLTLKAKEPVREEWIQFLKDWSWDKVVFCRMKRLGINGTV